jgi:hypothetical protein
MGSPGVGDTGLEHPPLSPGKTGVSKTRGNKSGNNRPDSGTPTPPTTPDDPALGRVVQAWPDLPAAVRAGIVAMVDAAKGESGATGGDTGDGDRTPDGAGVTGGFVAPRHASGDTTRERQEGEG